jgi:hypothetical protein
MLPKTQENILSVYQTITGLRIPLSKLSVMEHSFLELVAKKYGPKLDWTRFAAWWYAEFKAAGLNSSSAVYRICQDLEARLGIKQGKVSPPDYRDYLVDLIDTQFGSRQEFCRVTELDPGQLSRVLAGRGDLSMKILLKVLEVLHAQLVIQSEEVAQINTSVEFASQAISAALAL